MKKIIILFVFVTKESSLCNTAPVTLCMNTTPKL